MNTLTKRLVLIGGVLLIAIATLTLMSEDAEAATRLPFSVRYVGNRDVHLWWGSWPNDVPFHHANISRTGTVIYTTYDENPTKYWDSGLVYNQTYRYKIERYYSNELGNPILYDQIKS